MVHRASVVRYFTLPHRVYGRCQTAVAPVLTPSLTILRTIHSSAHLNSVPLTPVLYFTIAVGTWLIDSRFTPSEMMKRGYQCQTASRAIYLLGTASILLLARTLQALSDPYCSRHVSLCACVSVC